jgi:ABC-type maltose transport system permease subunit
MLSLSTFGGISAKHNPLMLTPAGFTLEAYTNFFKQKYIHSGYAVTIFRTIVGTLSSVFFMALAGYALSKKNLTGKKDHYHLFCLYHVFYRRTNTHLSFGSGSPSYQQYMGSGIDSHVQYLLYADTA